MEYEDFTAKINRASAFAEEQAVCDHCRAGYADTSDLPLAVPLGKAFCAEICTPGHRISCTVFVSDDKAGAFDLRVTSITVRKRVSRL